MRNKDSIRKMILASKNSRLFFQEIFLEKLKDERATSAIPRAQCKSEHVFKDLIKQIACVMFNMFAVNMAKEMNNKIHQERKRAGVSESDEKTNKRDLTLMKSKKFKSN